MRRIGITLAAAAVAAFVSVLAGASPARAADMVCAGTSGQGLLCLDSGGFKQFNRRNSQLSDDRIVDLAVCNGTIWLAAGEDIIAFDGSSFDRPMRVGRGLVERVACFGRDDLWAASQTALSFRARGEWKHYELTSVAGSAGRNTRIRGLAAGPNGSVWATLDEGVVVHFNGSEWRTYRQGQGFRAKHNLGSIAVDQRGEAWLPYAKGIYHWKDGRWDTTRGLPGAHFITVDDKNRLWLTSGARVASFDGGRKREIPTEQNTRAVAVDSAGVVWAATEFGLARFAGISWDSRQMHNSELADNDLMLIAALGKGAPLPAPLTQAKGSLFGKVQWSDGVPIADAEVQICGLRAFDFGIGKGPCDDKPLAARTKTGPDGAFRFTGLAPANYYFVIRAKGAPRWVRFATDPDRLKVKPGENKSAGTIVIDATRR